MVIITPFHCNCYYNRNQVLNSNRNHNRGAIINVIILIAYDYMLSLRLVISHGLTQLLSSL